MFAGKIGWHIPMLMRRAEPEESDRLGAFVLMITDEVYGYLWTMPSLTEARSAVAARIRNEDWSRAWVAFHDEILVGTLLTDAEWIDDLWVSKGYRGRGIGRQLLSRGEAEIAARGYQTLRLRVVMTNSSAVGFYERLGWKIEKEFPHETLGALPMLERANGLTLSGLRRFHLQTANNPPIITNPMNQ